MFCYHCGNEVGEGMTFCDRCGTKVGDAVPNDAAPTKPTERPTVWLMTDYDRTLALCRHPLMFVGTIAMSFVVLMLLTVVFPASMLAFDLEVPILGIFLFAVAALLVVAAVEGWLAVIGGFGNNLLADKGLAGLAGTATALGALSLLGAIASGFGLLFVVIGSGGDSLFGLTEMALEMLVWSTASNGVLAAIYLSTARGFAAWRYNLAIAADEENDRSTACALGRGSGGFLVVAGVVQLIPVISDKMNEDTLADLVLSWLGIGMSDIEMMWTLCFAVAHVAFGLMLIFHNNVIDGWRFGIQKR